MRDHRAVGCSAEDAMTAIGELVAMLAAAGLPADKIALAADLAQRHAVESSPRNSTGIPLDETTEKRRAYDRERKRREAEIRRNSTGTPRNSETALILPSKEESKEPTKQKKVRAAKLPLPPEFQPDQSHFKAAEELGLSPAFVHDKMEDMRIWAKSSGEIKADWSATLLGFIRRDARKRNERTYQNGSTSPARPRAVAQDVIIAGMADALSERPDSRLGGGCARGRGESETRHSHDPPEPSPDAGNLFDDRKASG
jgi:hypothetical protein